MSGPAPGGDRLLCQQSQPAPAAAANAASPCAAAPTSAAQALAAVRAGLNYLAAVNVAELTGAERAECLRGLATAESVHLAALAKVLAAFDGADDHCADGQMSTKAWLRWQTRITRAAAGAATAWMRRLAAHPSVAAALATGQLSPSWARQICEWSDLLPAEHQPAADQILTDAACGGADLDDVAALAEEIRARTARPDGDDPDDGFGRRRVFLTPHYQGNARLDGDLTPQAAAAVQAVLDSLGKRAGPEDLRSKGQRDHDALEEACRRLIASGCLPEVAGQPVQIQLSMTLSQLLGQPEADPAGAARAAANGAAAPPGADCDATIVPVVTGTIDHDLLDKFALRLLRDPAGIAAADRMAAQVGGLAWRAARQVAIAQAIRLLSGPSGLAAMLRTKKLAGPAASPSLPLDIGASTDTIPPHLRRAVARRDRHCRFPGCDWQPRACHVHHLTPRSEGGRTSLYNCCLVCPFHHLIAIHRWGWTLVLNPDGTTTATSPDGMRTLHSHALPVAA
jgi:Domain of unknown function (DUF222)